MFRHLLPPVAFAFALAACTTDEKGGSTPSLVPKGLSLAAFDTLESLATLTWNRVDDSRVLGYAVFRDRVGAIDLSKEPVNRDRVTDTFYVDTLPPLDADSLAFEYRVKVLDREGEYGPTSDYLTIRVPGPNRVNTRLDLDVLGDLIVSIGDTLRAVAIYSNPTRRISRVEWSDPQGRALRTTEPAALSGSDTLAHVLDAAGLFRLSVKLTDEAGTEWNGAILAEAILDAPMADAGEDSSVFFRDTLTLRGAGSDGLGRIVKWEWDAGRTGTFTDAPGGVLRVPVPSTPGIFHCVLRVTDDDGQTATDEVAHVVTNSRLIAPMVNARSKAQVAVLGGKIYAMGGSSFQKALELEEYDPERKTWRIVSTLADNRENFRMVAASGELYVLGGRVAGGGPVRTMWSFDPAAGTWKPRSNFPADLEYMSFSAVAEEGRISIVRRYSESGAGHNFQILAQYLTGEDRWTQEARRGYDDSRFTNQDFVYWGGMVYVPKATSLNVYVLDRFPLLTQSSKTMATLHGRSTGVLAPIGDRIYLVAVRENHVVVAGQDPSLTRLIHWFDPVADTWSQGGMLVEARKEPGICELGGVLYIVGGRDPITGNPLSSVEEYHPL